MREPGGPMTGGGRKHDQWMTRSASEQAGRRPWSPPRVIVSEFADAQTNPPFGPTPDHTPYGGSDLGPRNS